MDKKCFVVNPGSASKKYALYSIDKEILRAHFENEDSGFIVTLVINNKPEKIKLTEDDYRQSTRYLINLLLQRNIITDKNDIQAIGLRLVAPGSYFAQHRIIDKGCLDKLESIRQEAPLHINPIIEEIRNLQISLFDIPIVGISDSAFHATMPDTSRLYALPMETSEKLDIYRFGYHGISLQSITNKIKKLLGNIPPKTIICHLGSGSSITALKNGQSFDTSIGFTPLEGLPMSTRIGDIDAGAIIYLAQKMGFDYPELENYLNTECGLLGISGQSDDIRKLLKLETGGNKRAKLALELFVYRIKKYIGSYTAALNGLDLLIFSATVGERSFIIRDRICANLDTFGIILDQTKNNKTISQNGFIHKVSLFNKTKIAVITTDEMNEIFQETKKLLLKT